MLWSRDRIAEAKKRKVGEMVGGGAAGREVGGVRSGNKGGWKRRTGRIWNGEMGAPRNERGKWEARVRG